MITAKHIEPVTQVYHMQQGAPVLVSVFALEGKITKIEMELHSNQGMQWRILGYREERHMEKKLNNWMLAYMNGSILPPVELLFSWPKLGSYTQMVLQTLPAIPFGTTNSYDDVAILTGNTYAARAVGNACRKNPFPLIIPCHRVIGSNGKLIGFSSGGLEVKQALIQFEKSVVSRH